MAFALENINRTSSGANTNAPTFWAYDAVADNGATVAAAGYFDDFVTSLNVDDVIFAQCSDGPGFYSVTAVTPQVTVSAIATIGAGGIGSAQLQAGAVDNAALGVDAVESDNILDNTITSDDIATDVIQYANIPVTAAELNAAYAAPFLLLPAAGANTLYRIHDVTIEVDYGSAQFASGGAMALQYDNTANGAGVLASAALAAATINAWAADSAVGLAGAAANGAAAAMVNKGIYLSNLTGAFTTGTGTVLNFHISYSIVTTAL